MPQPPDVDDLDKLNFITAYFMQGCVPPFWLFVEFAKAPSKDLLMLLLGFDWEDILKDWLRPGSPRRRRPGRHGRKRRRRLPSLDPNDYVGSHARRSIHEYPGIDLPGSRALFKITDELDKVAINAAILEGVTDIGYESLLGILSAQPENCPTLPFFTAHAEDPQDMVGVASPTLPLSLPITDNNQFFQAPNPFVATTYEGDWTMAGAATVTALSAGGGVNVRLTIRSEDRGVIGESTARNLIPGESAHMTVSADCFAGEFCWMARTVTSGSLRFTNKEAIGFSGGLL